ncbi:FAD-dependent oxidoreductase [Rhodoplanes sp. Z2-YC6860]|uniref:FAD-dependent oxidoreductase n=1 Tax=Rhodoplanes sp. Z2-YC6860 TaxID=674703 RepID=UPI00078CE3BE|nr:FAD-binding protein [Rhodoplanes sp. Z2-YC6860]AMN41110.1 succinate dehydrogenase, flavoprotein subunit [Rhodoplanes sp. Z2-YC6860]
MVDDIALESDVMVVGGGGAGMFAAVAAARNGARVILIDKNVVGRGGATIMAQMTCASALGESEPDNPELHLKDTLDAGRGLCNEKLAALLCEGSPKRIRELEGWKVNWARSDDGKINQVKAPGHSRKRCVYVDFLSTGAAICAALRNKTSRDAGIRRLSNVTITDIVVRDGEVAGAVGIDVPTSAPVKIKCSAVILCTGGMTKMFQRTTASNNLAGEGVGLALRSGARVIDIEFLQFYPNGHLAPRMVGLDPTTWEPTRVKLGGRLLNGLGEEFLHRYGEADGGSYDTARDILTYAIYKEVEAGRGSPHGGVYLSFQHIDEQKLKDALGPVTEIFARNNINLTRQPVEIFPIAHYQMGGIEVDTEMASTVPGLYAAGEIAGGANGANRLSGNALPEALVFGERAGESAAKYATRNKTSRWDDKAAQPHLELVRKVSGRNISGTRSPGQLMAEVKALMWSKVGAFRNAADLEAARDRIHAMRQSELDELSIAPEADFNTSVVEWFELRNGLLAAEAVATAALNRQESRGAHQRDDFPKADERFLANQRLMLESGEIVSAFKRVGA